MKIALVSCTKLKADYPCCTRDMYQDSTLFKKAVKFIEQQDYDDWFVLSAKYGLLGQHEVIKPYDLTPRIGKSLFKKALLSVEKKCRLCGVSDERFLVASHIKPWSQSNNPERLDVNNGLLLCPNHDSLFDKGHISFDDNGTILISDRLDEATKVFLNINKNMKIRMNEGQREYMKWHRENIFKT